MSMNIVSFKLLVGLVVLLLLPSFVFVSSGQSSLGFGLLVSSVVLIFMYWRNLFLPFSRKIVFFVLISFIYIALDSIVSLYLYGLYKPLISLILIFPLMSSLVLSKELERLTFPELLSVLRALFLILLLCGVVKLIYMPGFLNYELRPKRVFPFSEESHFALSMGVIALPLIAGSGFILSSLVVVVMLGFAFLYPSLTFLVFACFGILVVSMRSRFVFICSFFALILVLPLIFSLDYFSARLNLADSDNLTALVFLQGLGLINAALDGGFGLGFQMLGSHLTPILGVSEKIYQITGRYMNLEDGGFLAAKLISEFGFVGLIFVGLYALLFIKFLFDSFFLRGLFSNCFSDGSRGKNVMAVSAFLGFFIELFLRGYGYFSPTLFLMLAFLFFLNSSSRGRGVMPR